MLVYMIVILTAIGCNRLKISNQEEKVLPLEDRIEIEVMGAEMRLKRVEHIDLESRTSEGYTPFHVVFMLRVEDGYSLLKKILSSSKLQEEVTKKIEENVTKRAKMVSRYVEDRDIVLLSIVRELINREDECGRTPLKLAVEEQSIEIIRACVEDKLVREAIDWNRKDSRGISPILEATLREDIEMCEILEMAGARRSYRSRILKAVEGGKRVILKELLERVDVNKYGGRELVDLTVKRQDIDTLKLLLKYGAEISKRLQKVGMMLFKERDKDIYEELLEMTEIKDGDLLSILMGEVDEEESGKTGLMYAIEGECDIEILEKIVSRMSIEEVLKRDIEGRTIESYESIHEEYIKELYKLYSRAKEGRGEILAMSYGGNLEMVSKLVESGANIEEVDEDGSTPLMCAAINNSIGVVSKLIELGANIEAVDKDGYVALMYAVQSDSIEVVSKLIELGANIDIVNKNGDTALILAVRSRNIEIVSKLISLRADLSIINNDGDTALALAVKSGDAEFISKLLQF